VYLLNKLLECTHVLANTDVLALYIVAIANIYIPILPKTTPNLTTYSRMGSMFAALTSSTGQLLPVNVDVLFSHGNPV
jgi:hypothetical protein